MKVYIVQFDWATEENANVELYVYDNYDKAYDKFKEVIANELNPDLSWVGEIEWKDDIPLGPYSFSYNDNPDTKQELHWHIRDDWDDKYSYINLRILEVM